MKKIICRVVYALFFGGVSSVFGVQLAAESFSTGNGSDYVSTSNFAAVVHSSNLTGTTGFVGKVWTNGTTLINPRSEGDLTHALVQGSTAKGAALIRPGAYSVGRNSNRALAAAPSGSSFYMSGLVKANNLTDSMDAGESAAMGLIDSIAANTWNISSGLALGITRNSSGDFYLAAFAAGNTYTLGSKLTSTQATQTQMIVLKLDVDTAGNNDTLTAWIAQQGSTNLTQVLSISDIDTGTAANLKTFVVQGLGAADAVTATGVFLDEFRFGTQLSDVTSIPEPATIGMLGLGALVAMVARRRFR